MRIFLYIKVLQSLPSGETSFRDAGEYQQLCVHDPYKYIPVFPYIIFFLDIWEVI